MTEPAQTKVDQLKNDNDSKWGNYTAETKVDNVGIKTGEGEKFKLTLEQEYVVINGCYYEVDSWNAAIEAAAEYAIFNDVKINQEQIRKLKK